MCKARIAIIYVHAYCQQQWPGEGPTEGRNMASTVLTGSFLDVFDHKGTGSHKYIPADRLTKELGLPEGAGVFGYVKMYDDSYILQTCGGALAYWSGKDDEPAKWHD